MALAGLATAAANVRCRVPAGSPDLTVRLRHAGALACDSDAGGACAAAAASSASKVRYSPAGCIAGCTVEPKNGVSCASRTSRAVPGAGPCPALPALRRIESGASKERETAGRGGGEGGVRSGPGGHGRGRSRSARHTRGVVGRFGAGVGSSPHSSPPRGWSGPGGHWTIRPSRPQTYRGGRPGVGRHAGRGATTRIF